MIYLELEIHPQKNTLLLAATSPPTNQSLQESIFFSNPRRIFSSPICFNFFSQTHGLSRKPKVTASNVNPFGQSVCKLDTTHLRTDSKPAHNKGLNGMAGEVVNRKFVHLINICSKLTVRASKPPLR